MNSNKTAQVFVSYSHKDQEWLNRLLTMLKPCLASNPIAMWSDKDIIPGSKWRATIDKALQATEVAVLLVSPDFLASTFIWKDELPRLFAAEKMGGITIQWIALRPSMYDQTALKELQALNDPSIPLSILKENEVETELVKICYRLKAALLKEYSAPVGTGGGGPTVHASQLDTRSISRKLADLEAAKKDLNSSFESASRETMAALKSGLPVELVMQNFMRAQLTKFEGKVNYSVKLMSTIEAIQNASGDPQSYGLPSYDEALASFQFQVENYSKALEATGNVMKINRDIIEAALQKVSEGPPA